MNWLDSFSLAWRTIQSNKLRTGITVAIIAFGIMALVGIVTAIAAMNQKFTESFSAMGSNGFTIRYKDRNIRFGGGPNSDVQLSKKESKKEKKSNLNKFITKDEAEQFIQRYDYPAIAGLSVFGSRANTLSFQNKKTNPNVTLFGADENYLLLNGMKIEYGRNINYAEVQSAQNICVIGADVAKSLFAAEPSRAVGAQIRINSIPFRVAGIIESKGSTFGFSRDNIVVVGYKNAERNFSSGFSYVIAVMAHQLSEVNEAMGEAEALFRSIRKLNTTEESNFILDKSDSIVESAMKSIGFLTISATVIGFITLIGAAIGLMNIMLVAVSERTKEVGLVKAIGGKSGSIRMQFLLEAIFISLLGAIFGIILGVLVGNLFSSLLGTGFVIPWNWILYGIIICSIVGLAAGLYPAIKASKLNPIDALRYE